MIDDRKIDKWGKNGIEAVMTYEDTIPKFC
jgi:hypothetical protein